MGLRTRARCGTGAARAPLADAVLAPCGAVSYRTSQYFSVTRSTQALPRHATLRRSWCFHLSLAPHPSLLCFIEVTLSFACPGWPSVHWRPL